MNFLIQAAKNGQQILGIASAGRNYIKIGDKIGKLWLPNKDGHISFLSDFLAVSPALCVFAEI